MPALSVSQVIVHLNNVLGSDVILSDVCVIGEVSRAVSYTHLTLPTTPYV